jgi:hypothetical protein
MKWKAIVILFLILLSLIPAYWLNQYFEKIIQPRRSLGRLFLYLCSNMFVVFVFTVILVLLIKLAFPAA